MSNKDLTVVCGGFGVQEAEESKIQIAQKFISLSNGILQVQYTIPSHTPRYISKFLFGRTVSYNRVVSHYLLGLPVHRLLVLLIR